MKYGYFRNGDYSIVYCDWGVVPTLYSSNEAAELACQTFQAWPDIWWPIIFRRELGIHSVTDDLEHGLYHNEVMLFLPGHCFLPWSWRIGPGEQYKVNLFSDFNSAYAYSAQRGAFSVNRIARRYRPAKRS